jgi:putative colanic acid biosynthesis UDP-glucose lipid carrier transferase
MLHASSAALPAASESSTYFDSPGRIIAPEPSVWTPQRSRDLARPIGGALKRLFDICAAAAGLVVFLPLLLLIALAVRLDSPGAAIFKQERGGFGARKFRIWKFRTMTVTEDGCSVVQARNHDARVTGLGRFLRKSSLDEFPQLVNVLIGDMSLVGPRPHALVHDAMFEEVDPRYPLRTRARPGITGLAQVSGHRGPTETPEKIRARTEWDLRYVHNWSFVLDVGILLRTVLLVIRRDPHAF